MRRQNIIYFLFFALVFLVAAYFGIATGNNLFFLAPFLLLGFLWICLDPSTVFYILLASIPWSIEFNFSQSLGTDLPDEPLMLLTVFAITGYLIFNKRKQESKLKFTPLVFLLLLQLTWMLISTFLSTDFVVSFKFILAKAWYLGAFVIAPFFIFQDRQKFIKAIKLLVISMMAFTVLTMIRHTGEGLDFAGINPSLKPFFRNHVNYSALLVCIIPLLYSFFTLSVVKRHRYFIAAFILIAVAAVYFSYARGAWLALITGIAAYWLIRKKWLLRSYIISFVFLIAGLAWLIRDNKYLDYAHDYNTTIFHKDFREHLIATYKFKDVSTAERFYRWVAAVRMVKYKAETGFGPNTFSAHYKEYAVPAFKTWVSKNEDRSTVHNYFLLTVVEQGFPGLVLLLVLIGYMFYTAQKIYTISNDRFVKTTAAAVASILVMLCTVNFLSDLVETDKLGSIFYLCFTTLLVLDIQIKRSEKIEVSDRPKPD